MSDESKHGTNVNAKPFVPKWTQQEEQQLPPPPPPLHPVPMVPTAYFPHQQFQHSMMPPPPGASYGQFPAYVVPTHFQHQAMFPPHHHHHHYGHHDYHNHHHQQQQQQLPPPPPPPPPPQGPYSTTVRVGGVDTVAPAPAQKPHPLCLMFLGPRGSGKSTQAKLAAEKYGLLYISSGDIARTGANPLLVVKSILEEHFGSEEGEEGEPRKYKGVALDRFISLNEIEAYYLSNALEQFNMFLDLVFLLMLDYDTSQSRAEAREGPTKPKHFQRRTMEHRAQFESCQNVFHATGKLRCIECDGKGIDEVQTIIDTEVEAFLKIGKRSAPLVPKPLKGTALLPITDYAKFIELRNAMQGALGVEPKFFESFPGSLMSSLMDEALFEKFHNKFKDYFVTLKADGLRVLLFAYKDDLYFIPQTFLSMYQLPNPPMHLTAAIAQRRAEGDKSVVPFVLDAEVVTNHRGKTEIYVFDFLLLFGAHGTRVIFAQRYEQLKLLFKDENATTSSVHLKPYVPIRELGKILPAWDRPAATYPIDGVIFQHDGFYTVGADIRQVKWKPRELCTVDFRLTSGEKHEKGWVFKGSVADRDASGTVCEVEFPKVIITVSDDIVEKDNLADGVVVEALNTSTKAQTGDVIWNYHKPRPDKLAPNKMVVAQAASKLKHMTFTQLLHSCERL